MNFTKIPLLDIENIKRLGNQIEAWCTPAPWVNNFLHWLGQVMPVRLKTRWTMLDNKKRHILVNISISLSLVLILNILHSVPWLHEKKEKAMDWIIAMNAGTHHRLRSFSDQPEYLYAFVDVDEWSYQAWGEPLFIPRKKLSKLIADVVIAQPKLVIVDIELDRSNLDAPTDDALLRDTLAELPVGPPVILVKSLRSSLKPNILPELRPSFLDKTVAESDRLYWASPTFLRDDNQSIRRWKIMKCAAHNQEAIVLPSVQLLAYALLYHGPSGNLHGELTKQMEKIQNVCTGATDDTQDSLILNGQRFQLDEEEQKNRIFYSMMQGGAPQMIQVGKEERSLFVTVPAHAILLGNLGTSLQSILHDRIVIIGGSFADSSDIHKTPLGNMPGAVVILNSLRSLFTYGVDHQPPWMVRALIEVCLIILTTYFFMWFNSFWGMILSMTILGLTLLPASIFAFRYGVWLDFAIPLLLLQTFRLWEELKKKHIDQDNKGWK